MISYASIRHIYVELIFLFHMWQHAWQGPTLTIDSGSGWPCSERSLRQGSSFRALTVELGFDFVGRLRV